MRTGEAALRRGACAQGLALVDLGQIDEGMRRLDEAMAAALSGDMTDLDAIGQTCCFLVHACQQVHDFDRPVQWCTQVKSFCQRWRVKTLFTICRTNYAAVLISRGAWAEAEQELQVACGQGDSRPYVARAAWVQLAELRRRQGRTDEARRRRNSTRTATRRSKVGDDAAGADVDESTAADMRPATTA
jgi:hypothetical protein